MSNPTTYIHLVPESDRPTIAVGPSRFVVVIEAEVSHEWQKLVSEWIVCKR
ncbi:DUF7684 family protein [Massilia sp. TWR1-2-2]|uniref:DUF7684 family protein n=1 Tax=Massilia sp. TWR1-2-2 TaxID=2804584 RepID=UPI003CEC2668